MKIFAKVKPRAKKEYIKKIDDTHLIVAVKEPPIKGKANEAVEKAIADYFRIKRFNVKIISGHASREKIVEIL